MMIAASLIHEIKLGRSKLISKSASRKRHYKHGRPYHKQTYEMDQLFIFHAHDKGFTWLDSQLETTGKNYVHVELVRRLMFT